MTFLKKQNFIYYNLKIWKNPVVLWCVMSLNDSAQAAFKKQLKINLVESYFQLLQKLIKVISGYCRRGYMHNVLMDKPCKSCVSKLYRHQNRYFYRDMNYVLSSLFLNLNIVLKMIENCSCNMWKHVIFIFTSVANFCDRSHAEGSYQMENVKFNFKGSEIHFNFGSDFTILSTFWSVWIRELIFSALNTHIDFRRWLPMF